MYQTAACFASALAVQNFIPRYRHISRVTFFWDKLCESALDGARSRSIVERCTVPVPQRFITMEEVAPQKMEITNAGLFGALAGVFVQSFSNSLRKVPLARGAQTAPQPERDTA